MNEELRTAGNAGIRLFEAPFDVLELVKVEARSADAKSILDLLSLGAGPGAELQVSASGSDEAEAVQAIQALFSGKFRED